MNCKLLYSIVAEQSSGLARTIRQEASQIAPREIAGIGRIPVKMYIATINMRLSMIIRV